MIVPFYLLVCEIMNVLFHQIGANTGYADGLMPPPKPIEFFGVRLDGLSGASLDALRREEPVDSDIEFELSDGGLM